MGKTKEMKNKPFAEAIKSYLDRRAAEDPQFAESYANPKKSISECCDYIVSEVRKQNRMAMTDDEVYGLAVHYFDEENPGKIDKGAASRAKVVVPELKEKEREQLRAEAISEYKTACINELKEKERKIRELAANRRKEDKMEQPTLF